MGLETPNSGPNPYDVFIGRGWRPGPIRLAHTLVGGGYEFDDLSDVTAARVGLTREGTPSQQYELTTANGWVDLVYAPPEGQVATGSEPPNAVQITLPPSANQNWVAGRYRFDIALTRGDGSIDTVLEGPLDVRIPA